MCLNRSQRERRIACIAPEPSGDITNQPDLRLDSSRKRLHRLE